MGSAVASRVILPLSTPWGGRVAEGPLQPSAPGARSRRARPLRARYGPPIFVLLLTYVRPLEDVDALMSEHMAWVRQQYEAGHFLVSGPRVPRTGGVILARGDDREAIEALAASDPFVTGGV